MGLSESTTPKAPESSKELEQKEQRELVIRATDAVSEVLERNVSIASLIHNTENDEVDARITAKRALRCITNIALKNSVSIAVGDDGVYDYVEGVVLYGASDKLYVEIMQKYQLTPAEATAIYALRELVGDYARKPGMAALVEALKLVDLTVHQAALDPEMAVAAFDEAGFLPDHLGNKQYDGMIFYPSLGEAPARIVDGDVDGARSTHIIEDYKEGLRRPQEEDEDEAWRPTSDTDFLKNLGF